MTRNLIQPASNMASLLAALINVTFNSDHQDVLTADDRGPTERPNSLSALMQILIEQAEHDGFKLITINTEAKRVIMACNRQGKPPPAKITTDIQDGTTPSVDSTNETAEASSKKKGGRAGTSIRCGCRMRVNINYHSKLQAWRVTSFESVHNHSYSAIQKPEDGQSWSDQTVSPFKFSSTDADNAISTYRSNWAYKSYGNNETDAAKLLQNLASNVFMPNSQPRSLPNTPAISMLQDNAQSPESRMASPVASVSTPNFRSSFSSQYSRQGSFSNSPDLNKQMQAIHEARMQQTLKFAIATGKNEAASANAPEPNRPREGIYDRRVSPISGTIRRNDELMTQQQVYQVPPQTPVDAMEFSKPPTIMLQRRGSLPETSPNGKSKQLTLSNPLKNLAGTAIEIDRYAMLHSSFKKLIAMACKKREWTEDVIENVGRMTQRLHEIGATGMLSSRSELSLPSPGGLLSPAPMTDRDSAHSGSESEPRKRFKFTPETTRSAGGESSMSEGSATMDFKSSSSMNASDNSSSRDLLAPQLASAVLI